MAKLNFIEKYLKIMKEWINEEEEIVGETDYLSKEEKKELERVEQSSNVSTIETIVKKVNVDTEKAIGKAIEKSESAKNAVEIQPEEK